MTMDKQVAKKHRWTFHRFGGVDQVVFSSAEDILNLRELDLKLWMVLSMPTTGLQVDKETLTLLDTDENGRIHPEELLAAVDWCCDSLADPALLLDTRDEVKIADIKDPDLAASARHILENLGRGSAETICLADVSDRARIFSETIFNGDGVVPPEAAKADGESAALIRDIVESLGGVEDRSGRQGVDKDHLERFFADAAAILAWNESAADPELSPLGPEKTAEAAAALEPLVAKIDDYFARCRLAAFDARSLDSLNREPEVYAELAAETLDMSVPEAEAFPLAKIAPASPLPLAEGINPAWLGKVRKFALDAVEPLLGETRDSIEESEWTEIKSRLAAYRTHAAAQPVSPVGQIDPDRLRKLVDSDLKERVEKLLERDLAVAPENERITSVEKLVRYCRDLPEILANYVNFADFYGCTDAVFQVGTLYFDGRACSLCVEVTDEARNASLSDLSGFFLAYCDLNRSGRPTRKIVAAVTDGDSDNIMVGRNGLFLDREGVAWDATVTRIVSNPISVREAFWLPYKKFIRMVEEQIAKRAKAADDSATERMSAGVESALSSGAAPAPAEPAAAKKPIELGTIALIGTAIGGISALVGGFMKALFGLGFWLPLGLIGILLLISGPSMLLASLKLRRRNLAPLLDANGWAINTRARINIPFGTVLTRIAQLPQGTVPSFQDPFSKKKRFPVVRTLIAILIIAAIAWYAGLLDGMLPENMQRNPAEELAAREDIATEEDDAPAKTETEEIAEAAE